MIDPKDLTRVTASEIKPGAYFYKKEDDGTFALCCIEPKELECPSRAYDLRRLTEKFAKEGRLYRRVSQPWENFMQ